MKVTTEGRNLVLGVARQAKQSGWLDDEAVRELRAAMDPRQKGEKGDEPFNLSRKDAAELAGVGVDTIKRWQRAGHLPHRRPGHRTVLYRRSDVLACVDALHEMNAGVDADI